MHPDPRQRSWHSRGEQSFLPGAWPRPPSLGLRPIHLVSVQKTDWILFRPLRGPEVCDAGFFSSQSLPLGGRTVRGTVRSGPGEATINHRCPSAHTGSDEGAIWYPTFPCRKEGATSCRLNEVFLLPRWASRSPPHPSPSVTASPRGEAFAGGTPPQRNAFSPKPCSRKMRIQIRARTWAPK